MAITDLYCRNSEQDDDFQDDLLEIRSPLEVYKQQIRSLFIAQPGTVMGATLMGVDLESEVFERQVSEQSLEMRILGNLQNYCSYYSQYQTQCRVRFGRGTQRDITVIEILVDGRTLFATEYR